MLLTYTHQTGAAKKKSDQNEKQADLKELKNGVKTWASFCRCMYSINSQWPNCLPLFSTSEHQEVFSTPARFSPGGRCASAEHQPSQSPRSVGHCDPE